MAQALLIEPFLAAGLPIIDVRSPGEFTRGHIPGAVNLPLFSNEERAIVGTLYKQQGREAAMVEGLRLVGPKLADMAVQAKKLATGGGLGVHCWRGGERSASVAWLLEKAMGLQVVTLKQGYKAFRRHVLQGFGKPWNLNVLGGYTGTGKTDLLHLLATAGEQVIDLEGMAHHKGSAYGGIGEAPQPSTEHFENRLWSALDRMDPERPIWVEDESQLVGRAKIPDAFFARMRQAPLFFVERPREERVGRLVADYGELPKEELAAATLRIQKRLGPQNAKAALEALEQGDLRAVARITLQYYDKTYGHGLASRQPGQVRRVDAAAKDQHQITRELKALAHGRTSHHPVDPV